MRDKKRESPYRILGFKLRQARQKAKKTVAEVSGAVEIETTVLIDIEKGVKRPSEDILLLLISHFSLKEEEANSLWELAGYGQESETTNESQQSVIVMPFDVRIVYADMAQVTANQYGVVMNFLQSAGGSHQSLAISRVGMSKEHAQNVLELLQKALASTESAVQSTKVLPLPKNSKKNSES